MPPTPALCSSTGSPPAALPVANAERSPVVIINGGPSAEDLRIQKDQGSFFSHSTGREKTDLMIFREVTEYAERAHRTREELATELEPMEFYPRAYRRILRGEPVE